MKINTITTSNVRANLMQDSRILSIFNRLLFGMFVLLLTITQPNADEVSESYDGILVEGAYIQTDFREPNAILKLKISNFSSSDMALLGVRTQNYDLARLLMNGSDSGIVQVDSITILQEETLNLDTSHIWVELSGLKRAIQIGEKIEIDLLFTTGEVTATADIHSSKS